VREEPSYFNVPTQFLVGLLCLELVGKASGG
jgi:hypothetical protein